MRLIDADAMNDKYGDWYTEEGPEEGYIGTIKGIADSMPTIKPEVLACGSGELTEEAKWIPCKVRKPEKSGQYLVTKRQKTGQIILATAHYSTAYDEWSGSGSFKDVLAWMPLPKPYKEGESDV